MTTKISQIISEFQGEHFMFKIFLRHKEYMDLVIKFTRKQTDRIFKELFVSIYDIIYHTLYSFFSLLLRHTLSIKRSKIGASPEV